MIMRMMSGLDIENDRVKFEISSGTDQCYDCDSVYNSWVKESQTIFKGKRYMFRLHVIWESMNNLLSHSTMVLIKQVCNMSTSTQKFQLKTQPVEIALQDNAQSP